MTDSLIFGLLLVIVGFVAWLLLDAASTGETTVYKGTVLSKQYVPARDSTGVGTGVGANGQTVVVTTYNHASEQWLVIVQAGSVTLPVKVNAAVWAATKEGSEVTVKQWKSLSGWHVTHSLE